jgi:hypothetical protein
MYYHVHKNQLPVHIPSQMSLVHNLPPYMLNVLHVPDVMTIFRWFSPITESVQIRNFYEDDFYGEEK